MMLRAILLIPLLLLAFPAWAAPRVVTSIMPVHSIVSAVMAGVGSPVLLLPGRLSEHTASFTAAQISHLSEADLVFIVSRGLERKLAELSGGEAVAGQHFVELAKAPGVKSLTIRGGGAWETHHHDAASSTEPFDPHLWLDPENAKAMAKEIALSLSQSDPANSSAYRSNDEAFARDIDALSQQIASKLEPVKNQPFIVFHDAYQYFENRFGLNAVGAIADVSAAAPSAKRLKEIRGRLKASGAVCVFREPQFDERFSAAVIEGSNARPGVLDPLGADLEPGPSAYRQLLQNLATALKSCLAG